MHASPLLWKVVISMRMFSGQIQQVVQMNVSWQVLHEQREKNVAELKLRINELQLQLQNAPAASDAGETPSQLPLSSSYSHSVIGHCSGDTGAGYVTDFAAPRQEDLCELKGECSRLKGEKEEVCKHLVGRIAAFCVSDINMRWSLS
jgi:hypothetical protein